MVDEISPVQSDKDSGSSGDVPSPNNRQSPSKNGEGRQNSPGNELNNASNVAADSRHPEGNGEVNNSNSPEGPGSQDGNRGLANPTLLTPERTRRIMMSPEGAPTPGSVVPGTPLRQRRDLGTSPMRLSSAPETPSEGGSPGESDQIVVWGTTINYEESLKKVKDFFEQFTLPHEDEPLYMHMFQYLEETDGYVLNIDMEHMAVHNRETYDSVINYPTDMITILDIAANTVFGEKYPESKRKIDEEERHRIQTRPYGLRKEHVHTMRDLNPAEITTLIGVQGMVIRVSPIIPDIQTALYRCNKCFHTKQADIQYGRIEEPRKCESCNTRDSYALLHTRSVFSDKQMMRLQEAPESIPKGETPATFTLVLYDSLVDSAKPGDRVEVTGILRASPVRLNPKMRSVRSIFRTYIDCVHMAKLSNNAAKLGPEDEAGRPDQRHADTAEQLAARKHYFEDLAKHPLLYETLTDSLAPSIFGMRDEKKGVLLQLFGGTDKDHTPGARETGSSQFRSAINILLVGDPGTSKSQLLQCVHRLAPRGIYTSGRGSSAVGLTAYVTKDSDTNDYVLESGALVLSDRGVCCIDEFDKMSDFARSVLHEAMEQQTVSIAKAGIIATLNARTSVLAAANPVGSRYNTNASVVDNIDLPPTLLSRFDLIYLVLDSPSADEDRRLAKHIVSLFYKNFDEEETRDKDGIPISHGEDGEELMDLTTAPTSSIPPARRDLGEPLDSKTLTDYIAYAKRQVNPKLSNEAADALVNGYIEMRSAGRGSSSITATPRQLESLIRLAEAHARMALKKEVDESDVAEAIRLVKSAMHAAAFDPHTGKIDMDLFAMGRSKVNENKINTLARVIKNELQTKQTEVKLGFLLKVLRQNSDTDITSGDFREAVRHLEEQQVVVYTSNRTAIRLIE